MRLGKRSRSKSSRSMANIGEEKYNSENIPEELMDERNDNNSS